MICTHKKCKGYETVSVQEEEQVAGASENSGVKHLAEGVRSGSKGKSVLKSGLVREKRKGIPCVRT